MQKVYFHKADRELYLKERKSVKEAIQSVFNSEKKELERIDYIFCSDEYLLGMNNRHLAHDYYTDILTFDLSSSTSTIAEVYISLDRVRDNAANLQQTIRNETLRVLFHGALHLCGYKDKTIKEATLMRQMEDKYVQLFNIG